LHRYPRSNGPDWQKALPTLGNLRIQYDASSTQISPKKTTSPDNSTSLWAPRYPFSEKAYCQLHSKRQRGNRCTSPRQVWKQKKTCTPSYGLAVQAYIVCLDATPTQTNKIIRLEVLKKKLKLRSSYTDKKIPSLESHCDLSG